MRLIVTAGPTCEDLDEVRYLTNRSSGKMGYALAAAAVAAGHEVVLVSGPVALAPPEGTTEFVSVRETAELLGALQERSASADALVMAAAVCDWRRPERELAVKTEQDRGPFILKLVRTPDILRKLLPEKGKKVFAGFALESGGLAEEGRERARRKLREKGLDFIVLNGPETMDSETIDAEIIPAMGKITKIEGLPKAEAAGVIIAEVERLAQRK